MYDRAPGEVLVSLPPRDYEIPAHLLARALEQGTKNPRAALADAARELGREVGAEVARRAGSRPSARRRRECLWNVLRERGYEPFDEDGTIRLRNCPFHALATQHRELVCGMNLDMLTGTVDELGGGLCARLDPRPDQCCVTIA